MVMTDPIADFLTRIRNANMNLSERVDIPWSKNKEKIAGVLKEEGFIRNYRVIDDRRKSILRVYLKYGPNKERVINSLSRVSKSSVRVYAGKDKVPRVRGGLGISILSTNRGVMSGKQARQLGIGGEVICVVW